MPTGYEVKIIASHFKGFQNKEELCFPFWIILFVLEKLTFLYYANEESDTLIRHDCNSLVSQGNNLVVYFGTVIV